MKAPALKVHLISMPWAMPRMPSIQTGTLKAYLDHRVAPAIETEVYSPHFSIHYDIAGPTLLDFYDSTRKFKEFSYFALWNGLEKLREDAPVPKETLKQLKRATE